MSACVCCSFPRSVPANLTMTTICRPEATVFTELPSFAQIIIPKSYNCKNRVKVWCALLCLLFRFASQKPADFAQLKRDLCFVESQWGCGLVAVCGGTPPTLDDSLKAVHGCFMYNFSLNPRSLVCFLDLDLQQEEAVWGLFSGDQRELWAAWDCKEISESLRRGIMPPPPHQKRKK